jgi:O-methyltransferase
MNIKKIYRTLFSKKFRKFIYTIKNLIMGNFFIIHKNSYADDGTATNHITDFMKDKKFIKSYNLGKKTGALNNHPGDIHFRAYIACYCATHAKKIKGDFVECGVGKGIISTIICNYLNFNNIKKNFYLIDTFQGIPINNNLNKNEIKTANFLNKIHFNNNYYENIVNNFKNFNNVNIIQGEIPTVFKKLHFDKISFLHLDMNNGYAEIESIKFFYPKITVGGLVLLDDYAYDEMFRDLKNCWDKYAKENNLNILTLPTGQGLIIKI